MPHSYGWENRSKLLKSLSASLIVGFLYLMWMSVRPGFAPLFVLFAATVSAIGFGLSGRYGSVTPVWAVVSGTVTGILIVVQSVAVTSGLTVPEGLLTLVNIPVMIGFFLTGYAAVYFYENPDQLF